MPAPPATGPAHTPPPQSAHTYSPYDGFKSFARNGALSIEDIVKGLSQEHIAPSVTQEEVVVPQSEPVRERQVEPIPHNVEPVYENVEPVSVDAPVVSGMVPPHLRGFVAALVEGDRVAVFASLRQHVRGGGDPEQLLSTLVCLLDDTYRARIDGTSCDATVARLTARLSTPTLESLITSLTTAIDSSYSTGVTGAKLALTRALTVLGA